MAVSERRVTVQVRMRVEATMAVVVETLSPARIPMVGQCRHPPPLGLGTTNVMIIYNFLQIQKIPRSQEEEKGESSWRKKEERGKTDVTKGES